MLHVQAFAHANISVRDLDKARAFYGGLLGLKEIPRPPFDNPGVWYEIGDVQIHLSVRDLPPSQEGPGPGRPHLAFWVDDPETVVGRLRQAGVFVRDVPENASGYHQLFIADPDGNVVELIGPRRKEGSTI